MLQGKVSFFGEAPERRVGRHLLVIVRQISIQKFTHTVYPASPLNRDRQVRVLRGRKYG